MLRLHLECLLLVESDVAVRHEVHGVRELVDPVRAVGRHLHVDPLTRLEVVDTLHRDQLVVRATDDDPPALVLRLGEDRRHDAHVRIRVGAVERHVQREGRRTRRQRERRASTERSGGVRRAARRGGGEVHANHRQAREHLEQLVRGLLADTCAARQLERKKETETSTRGESAGGTGKRGSGRLACTALSPLL